MSETVIALLGFSQFSAIAFVSQLIKKQVLLLLLLMMMMMMMSFIIRPYRMHEMRTIAIDDPRRLSVCHAVSLCKHSWTDRDSASGGNSWDPRNIALGGSPDFPRRFDAAFAPNYFGCML